MAIGSGGGTNARSLSLIPAYNNNKQADINTNTLEVLSILLNNNTQPT